MGTREEETAVEKRFAFMNEQLLQNWILRVVIFLSTLVVVYAAIAGWTKVIPEADDKDALEYRLLGGSLSEGQGLLYRGTADVILSPGYPLLIAVAELVLQSPWNSRVVTLMAFVAGCVMLFLIGMRVLQDITLTVIGAILAVGASQVLWNAISGFSESVYVLFVLLIVWLCMRRVDSPTAWSEEMLLGILIGFAYLIRSEGILLLPVGGYLMFRRLRWCGLLRVSLFVLILTFPYLCFLREQSGAWIMSGKTYPNLVMGELESPYQSGPTPHSDRYRVIQRTHADPTEATLYRKYLASDGIRMITRIPHNVIEYVKYFYYSISLIGCILAAIGLACLSSEVRSGLIGMWAISFVYLLFFVLWRHLSMYHWITALFMTVALHRLSLRFDEKSWSRTLVVVIPFVCILLFQLRSFIRAGIM